MGKLFLLPHEAEQHAGVVQFVMNNLRFDFELDPDGPRGIALSSWLEKDSLALVVIDAQNFITLPRYSGIWTAAEGASYYYSRLQNTVLPTIQRLIAACRELDILVCFTRIASSAAQESEHNAPYHHGRAHRCLRFLHGASGL